MQNVKNSAENPVFEMEKIINEMAESKRRAKNVMILNLNDSLTANSYIM